MAAAYLDDLLQSEKMAEIGKKTMPSRKKQDTQKILLSIIIVNFNVKEFLEQTLVSVFKAVTEIPTEVIVIDNASTDGSTEFLKKQFPKVKTIANEKNMGFAKASNQGLRIAQGKFFVLLNPDTIVQEDTFTKTVSFFDENSETGLLGCKILNPDGSLQLACRRSFPTPWVAFSKLSGLSALFSKSKLFGKYNLTYLDPDQTYEVEAISGSFMMIRRETVEQIGLLDEAFFMYGEDLDWCYRVGQSGWKVMYYPHTQIIHFKGESSKKAKLDSMKTFYSAMGLFAEKHLKNKYFFMPYWFIWIAIWLHGAFSFVFSFIKTTGVGLTDFFFLSLSLLGGVYFRFGHFENIKQFLPVMLLYIITWMTILKSFGCYNKNRFSSSTAGLAFLTGFLLNSSLTFFLPQYAFSRAVVIYSSLIGFVTIPGWRLFIKLLATSGVMPFRGTFGKTLLARNTILIGDLESCRKLIQKLNVQIESGYNVTGLVLTNGDAVGETISGAKVLGGIDNIASILEDKSISEVIFSTHQLAYDQILNIIATTDNPRINFKLIPSNLDVIIGKASIDRIDDVPFLEIDYKLHQRGYKFLKRTNDMALAILLLFLSLPFFLFKKFVANTTIVEKRVCGSSKVVTLKEFEGRGRVIRKIPHLWSILKGDLSFVGSEIQSAGWEENDIHAIALRLKPGLTGLAQINYNKNLTSEEKDKYLVYYLKNYSPFLDLEILFKALFNR